MYCSHCGSNLDEKARFCPGCGQVTAASSPLKRRSLVIMVLLFIVTFGFYMPSWFLLCRKRLNGLKSNEKLAVWPFVAVILLMTAGLVTAPVPAEGDTAVDSATGVLLLSDLMGFVGGIVIVWQSFKVRHILEDHFQDSQPELSEVLPSVQRAESALSGVGVFFLTIFYLQYVINKRVAAQTVSELSA